MAHDANRFDALRLLFAGAVAIYHLALLGGLTPDPALLARGAELGVQGFFIISGALVWRSLERSRNVVRYAEKRARRILPAYLVVIAIPTLAGLALSAANAGGFAHVLRYAAANLVFLNFLEPTLPHLFEQNPRAEVNGALWTIKVEVMFYAALPLLAWGFAKAGARGRWIALAILYVMGEAWRAGLEWRAAEAAGLYRQLSYQLPGQMAFFASGIALAWKWDWAKRNTAPLALAGAAAFLLSFVPLLEPLRAAGLAALVAAAAFAPGPQTNAARWGDLSYGVYITHFPIIQTLVAAGLFARPFVGAALAIAVTIAAALAMWRWVEAPFLLKDSHYHRRAE